MIFCARATRGRGLPSLDVRTMGETPGHSSYYEYEGTEKRSGAAGHPRCSSAPGTRALRRALFDNRSWSDIDTWQHGGALLFGLPQRLFLAKNKTRAYLSTQWILF